MKKNVLFFLLLSFVLSSMGYAQGRRVEGRVTAADTGLPLAGVSVREGSTANAVMTNEEGRYVITVSPGANLLEFTYVGYGRQRIGIADRSVLDVEMRPESTDIDEVVVVGYGTTTREAFTGSAKRIDGETLERKNVSNISQALAGEVSGVSVISGSGQPGSSAPIRIRGFGSVNGNRAPLYVVDGVPYYGQINAINPADIESSTILKDATATAIYGSRGANGVILINTKNGKGQGSFVEADASFGSNMALLRRYDVITSPEDYIGLVWEALYNEGTIDPDIDDPLAHANDLFGGGTALYPANNIWNVSSGADLIDPNTRTVRPGVTRKWTPEIWKDHAFQNALRADYNVRFGGSSNTSNHFTSLGYLTDKGYSVNSDFERFSARMNIDNQVKSWLNTGINMAFSRSEQNIGGQSEDSGSVFWFVDNMPPIYPLFERDAEGNMIPDEIYGGNRYDYGENNARRFGSLTNSISDAHNSTRRHRRNELNGRAYMNFNIIDGLTFENSLGIGYYHNLYHSRNSKFYGSTASVNGSIGQTRTERFSYNLLNLLRYRTQFGANAIEMLAAHEVQVYNNNVMTGSKTQLVRDDSDEFDNAVVTNPLSSYTNRFTLESYFAQVNYDYDGKYYLSGSVRRDGSSRFINEPWGTFGSLGAAWILSREDFMMDQNVANFLKFKISYGTTGDQEVGDFYPGLVVHPISNLNDRPAIGVPVIGNPDLSWESARMFQTGLEFDLGTYLSGSVDYYIKNTSNLIFERRVGPSIGYALLMVNEGRLRNQGVEFDLTGHLVRNSDFYLDLNINGEHFRNRITEMPIEPATGEPKVIDVQGRFGWGADRSIFDYYIRDFVGVDPADGRSMWKVYYTDDNGNGAFDSGEQIGSLSAFENPTNESVLEATTKSYTQATLHYVGKSAIPFLRGAVNLRTGYRNFDLSVQFLYSLGGYAYDVAYAGLMSNPQVGGNNWHRDIFNRWQEQGDVTDVPRISNNIDQNVVATSTRFLTKADYLSLNNIRLMYTFPGNLLNTVGFEGASVWVSGDNLWYASARQGFFPSTAESGASDMYRYSPLSTISAGLRLKF